MDAQKAKQAAWQIKRDQKKWDLEWLERRRSQSGDTESARRVVDEDYARLCAQRDKILVGKNKDAGL